MSKHTTECTEANDRSARELCICHGMRDWDIYWSPEGRKIATVPAKTAKAAIRKAPMPYRKYLGEMYAKEAN